MAAGEYLFIQHSLEGSRVANLGWNGTIGTQLVLRFGFKGPPGTHAIAYRNGPATRAWVSNFTISAGQANTDVEITKIIPADTTGGVWPSTAAVGATMLVTLASGSTFITTPDSWQTGNLLGGTGISNGFGALNTFELFDVGLYPDPDLTGFAPAWVAPKYDADLRECMRYFQKPQSIVTFGAYCTTAGNTIMSSFLPCEMRVNPSVSFSSVANTNATGLTNLGTTSSALIVYATTTATGTFACGFIPTLNART